MLRLELQRQWAAASAFRAQTATDLTRLRFQMARVEAVAERAESRSNATEALVKRRRLNNKQAGLSDGSDTTASSPPTPSFGSRRPSLADSESLDSVPSMEVEVDMDVHGAWA